MKKLFPLCFLLFFCFFTYAQTKEQISNEINHKIEKKEYESALALSEKLISLNDSDQWSHMKKAEIEIMLYGLRPALSTLFKAVKYDRKNGEIYNRIASYYERADMADSAINMYNVAIKLSTSDTMKYYYMLNRGTAKASKRDFKGALIDMENVLTFYPNDLGVLNNIAALYDEIGEHAKSINTLKKAINIDSSFIGPIMNLGFLYSNLDSLELALHYFDIAAAKSPNDGLVYSNRGHLYYKMGKYDLSQKDLNKSIQLYPQNSYVYRNLALLYIAQNKKSEACDALRFAKDYGFEYRYGDEVNQLIKNNCK